MLWARLGRLRDEPSSAAREDATALRCELEGARATARAQATQLDEARRDKEQTETRAREEQARGSAALEALRRDADGRRSPPASRKGGRRARRRRLVERTQFRAQQLAGLELELQEARVELVRLRAELSDKSERAATVQTQLEQETRSSADRSLVQQQHYEKASQELVAVREALKSTSADLSEARAVAAGQQQKLS